MVRRFRYGQRIQLAFQLGALIAAVSLLDAARILAQQLDEPPIADAIADFTSEFCIDCHHPDDPAGEFAISTLDAETPTNSAAAWERAIRRLRTRQMPPPGALRPDESRYREFLNLIEGEFDAHAIAHPAPGPTMALRRLTRTEYQNAIRDLLALEIDASRLLPKDPSSHGFDNITVSGLSPTRMERYIDAAEKISRLALGGPLPGPVGETYRVSADRTQERRVEGLPLGTRGGTLIQHTFPREGEYLIEIRLARDRNEEVEGLKRKHHLEIIVDREPQASFVVEPPEDRGDHQLVDAHLRWRTNISAGPHQIGVTFREDLASLLETKRQPYQAQFNMHRHPRSSPAIYEVSITGPFVDRGPGDTPSRRRILVAQPENEEEVEGCARIVLSTVLRRAYRRPIEERDLRVPLEFFRTGYRELGFAQGGFDNGIQQALSAILVNPNFLFRIERTRDGPTPGSVVAIQDLELASRLSFFLWSSIPDDELLDVAERGQLSDPVVLEAQVRRMLADRRSRSLATNFAAQWLQLRNLDGFAPNLRRYPDFDDNLRAAFRAETEKLFERVIREDLSVVGLLKTDETYLNERLAKHYGIPHVYGSRFRLVSLADEHPRGGILRHGSILCVTSYSTRTSPVIRGNWVLETLIGTPPPPPPANVPALKENTVASNLSVRDRLDEHRANVACASCHNLMDPVGFSLEQFDAVGRWRVLEDGLPVDASGGLPSGVSFSGVDGLEAALAARPEVFVETMIEKLTTFALGRGIEPSDAPYIRQILRDAARDEYRLSSIVLGITRSVPFQMRQVE